MSQSIEVHDDEIDLRKIILTLFKSWKLIILLTIVGGAIAFGINLMQPTVYEAHAIVSMNVSTLPFSTNPINFLVSDDVRDTVAATLDISPASLPVPSVTADSIDKTLFVLTFQSADARHAAEIVNTWAEAGVLVAQQELYAFIDETDESILALEKTDRALLTYLNQHGLDQWTWNDLVALTGLSSNESVIIVQTAQLDLPMPSVEERLEIGRLMLVRIDAQFKYSKIQTEKNNLELASANSLPKVLNKAIVPNEPILSRMGMITVMGGAMGLLLAVFLIVFSEWWKK